MYQSLQEFNKSVQSWITGPLCILPSIIKQLQIWNEIELDKLQTKAKNFRALTIKKIPKETENDEKER